MDPKKFHIYKIFEPGLEKAPSDSVNICSEKGYPKYDSTVTHGVPGLLSVTLDLYAPPAVVLEEEACCHACDGNPLEKYFSIDHMHNKCGEACMDPKKFHLYKIFEPGLEKAPSDSVNICSE